MGPRIWDIYGALPPFCGHHEAVFRRDGTYHDTGLFRGKGPHFVVWSSGDESFVRVGANRHFMFYALRTDDWGWQLIYSCDLRLPARAGDEVLRFLPYFQPSSRLADATWEEEANAVEEEEEERWA